MMFANNSYHSTSPNMFAMCSSRAHLNLENIFRRCQISHWTKLEAPYKGCTVICTFFIKWPSLKIMKFLIENFLFELLAEHFATGITWFRTSTLWLIFFDHMTRVVTKFWKNHKNRWWWFFSWKFSFGRKKWKFAWTWVILSRLRK